MNEITELTNLITWAKENGIRTIYIKHLEKLLTELQTEQELTNKLINN